MEKLKICRCFGKNGTTPDTSKTFVAMLNPGKFTHSYGIAYNKNKNTGQSVPNLKYAGTESETMTFDILLDNTGVIHGSSDVQAQIKKLNSIIYDYNGEHHEPNRVRIVWGRLVFYGRLESMRAEYTLFSPEGAPLRANISMSFKGFMSPEEEARRASKSSPDMTHTIVFKAGDSLPLLCQRVYDDAGHYVAVARINNITNFREIAPGTQIVFPPLR